MATPPPGLRPAAVALRAVSPHERGWFRRLGWVSSDEFSLRYSDLVTGSYDCVDRIVLNAFFPLGHNPGGFRNWWRRWHGDSDAELDNTHLMRMAGRFARRVKAWGAANGVPVIFCTAGERKHRIAEAYLAGHEVGIGVFLVLVAKAPAPVWKVARSSKTATIVNIERRREYVNHYSFHIIDPEWGHVTIKMSGHPPFGAQIILNGHEFVARQATAAGIAFGKVGNCFTAVADPAGLARIADALSQDAAVGRLGQVCQRWIYTASASSGPRALAADRSRTRDRDAARPGSVQPRRCRATDPVGSHGRRPHLQGDEQDRYGQPRRARGTASPTQAAEPPIALRSL
jgi:hypothetical protein